MPNETVVYDASMAAVVQNESVQSQHLPEFPPDRESVQDAPYPHCDAGGGDANEPIEKQKHSPRFAHCGWYWSDDSGCQTTTMMPMRPNLSRRTKNCASTVVPIPDCFAVLLPPLDLAAVAAVAVAGCCDCSAAS